MPASTPTIPAFSTVMACSTSMVGAFEAAGMIDGEAYNLALVGGVDSLSRIQIGLGQRLSDWLRKFQQARSLGQKLDHVTHVQLKDIRLYIPAITNRTTGMSMGEHTEITAKDWQIGRARAGRDRAGEPPARGRRLGQGLLRRPRDRRWAASAATPSRARTPRWRSSRACRRRSTAPAARAR